MFLTLPELEVPDPDATWAASGAMALTGRGDGPPLLASPSVVTGLLRLAAALRELTPVSVDSPALLGERAATAGFGRHGDVSCGRATRLLPAADGWLAVTLARPEDFDALAAWLGTEVVPADLAERLRSAPADHLVERAALLGLPVARLGEAAPPPLVNRAVPGEAPPRRSLEGTVVIDLSSLWAGPLCAHLLQLAGARVIKVESETRPDGARNGPAAFFDLLHAGQESVVLDFRSEHGREALRRLVAGGDVVIEASRPRALAQLGAGPEQVLAEGGPQVWVSITGHGRSGSPAQRVAFGDDAAVAGGLVVWDGSGPCFCADAVADPAAGLLAAAAVASRLRAGGRWLLDVTLSGTAAFLAGGGGRFDGRTDRPLPVAPPRARLPAGSAPAFGAHTEAIRRELWQSMIPPMIVVRDAEVAGRRSDVLIDGATIATIAPRVAVPAGAEVIEARGGALLPGLHDHHLHLLAMAAARRSVLAGPPEVRTPAELAGALRRAARELQPGAWLRAVGYHDSVAGNLGRAELDRVVADRPVRVQHRSGAMWMLNSMALDRLGIAALDRRGIERDGAGCPTGRLFGLDDWLRGRVAGPPPALAPVGEELTRYGVTGVTDATPTERAEDAELLAAAVRAGDLPQRVRLTGGLRLPADAGALLPRGPVKLVVDDHDLPGLDALAGSIAAAHHRGRPVAVHAVTRAGLLLALAAWDEAGPHAGDRLEHGAVVPPGQAARLAALGVTVVTQPAFVRDRGDDYLVEVEAGDVAHLWPCRSLADAGVAIGGSSDAPFGHPDPWRAMSAATTRRTLGGRMLGPEERIDPEAALRLYLAPLDDPGGPPRTLRPGGDADLVLLGVPRAEALENPCADMVVATICRGRLQS